MKRAVGFLAVAVLLIPILSTTVANAFSSNYFFYVFGSVECPHCVPMKKFLEDVYGSDKVYFCDVYLKIQCYNTIIYVVNKTGIIPALPMTFIFNGTLRAILIGDYENASFINKLLNYPISSRVPVFYGPIFEGFLNIPFSLRGEFLWKFKMAYSGLSIKGILLRAVSLAAIDSVNPCTFVVYASLLVTVAVSGGRRRVFLAAAAFIAAVFTSYTLMGLGLSRALHVLPKWVAPVVAIVYSILVFTRNLSPVLDRVLSKPGEKAVSKARVCRACRVYEEEIKPRASIASNPILWALIIGFLVSVTLLPCTAGPYIIFTAVIAGVPVSIALPLLLVYNVIFITPLAAIAAGVSCVSRAEKIAMFMERNSSKIEAAAATVILAIAIKMLL